MAGEGAHCIGPLGPPLATGLLSDHNDEPRNAKLKMVVS